MSDIATLFSRDPLHMSDEDFSAIIKKFRENRTAFTQATPAAKAPTKAAAAKKLALDLDIGDIDV